jgi:hypothetical protein
LTVSVSFLNFYVTPPGLRKIRVTQAPKSTRFLAACLTVLAFGPQTASGSEEGLYPKAPPPNSAFVRFTDATGPSPLTVQGQRFPKTRAGGAISPYAPLAPGPVEIIIGAARLNGALAPGGRYIAAAGPSGPVLLREPAFDPFLKGQMILLNLAPAGAAALMAGKNTVITDVGPMTLGAREVNPTAAAFSVRLNGREVARFPARVTPRGESRVIVVTSDGATDNDPAKTVP